MTGFSDAEIKRQKGTFWSRPGAATGYEAAVSSSNGVIQLKNRVERAVVLRYAQGLVLDAGTGTGRFALPLARRTPGSVVALDYSREMLDLNRQLGSAQRLSIVYAQGDVEHLPFPTACFDTVVSITVVRHFPQYQNILREYVRVLKPGGKLIFEMCSGDHISRANRIAPRFGVKHGQNSFYSYEVEIPFTDLRIWLDSIGVDIVQRLTYDLFNNNCLLRILTWNDLGYKTVHKAIGLVLRISPIQKLVAWMETAVFCHLPPSFSYNYMLVCSKR